MIKAFYCCLSFFLALGFSLNGQGLKLGDQLPSIAFKNVYNYHKEEIIPTSFKKKFILLDFWSTNCSGCIKSFKRMDSLQKQFNDNLQIIFINRSTLDSTKRFFETRKKLYKPDIPFITGDTLLQKFFPHKGEPYHVLLDSTGKVLSIPNYLTASFLKKTIQGVNPATAGQNKQRFYLNHLTNENIAPYEIYHSVIFRSVDGLQLRPCDKTKFDEIYIRDASISRLFGIAYSNIVKDYFLKPGRIVVESPDSVNYFRPKSDDIENWKNNYSFSYQLILPKNSVPDPYKIMQQDLERVFPVKAHIEKRKIKCLTLICTTTKKSVPKKNEKQFDNFNLTFPGGTVYDSIRIYQNKDFQSFSSKLRSIIEYNLKIPYMDGTGFPADKLISFQMNGEVMDSLDMEAYKKALQRYGFDLVEKEWLVDVLILRETKRK